MPQFISVSANHKYIDQILAKAKILKLEAKDEISWDDGYKYSDQDKRNIKIFPHSEALWKYLLEIEPLNEQAKRKSSSLTAAVIAPTSEEIVEYGYEDDK